MEIVDGKPYIEQVKNLIIEYTKKLGRDLTFQNIDDELKDLARKYTEPEGKFLVAIDIRENASGFAKAVGSGNVKITFQKGNK